MDNCNVADSANTSSVLSVEEIAAIDAAVEKLREDNHAPGFAMAIARDDQVVYEKCGGLRDVEGVLKVTPDTVFPISYLSKAFTAMVLEMSQDEGLLSLDDHPRKYLPYFRLRDPESDAGVQIRDLLCHQTGIAARAGNPYMCGGVLTLEEMIGILGAAQPKAKLRERPLFNSVLFAAAGDVAARANETSWSDLVKRKLFQPLGMSRTRTVTQTVCYESNYAKGYGYDSGSETPRGYRIPDMDAVAPALGIYSSIRDMARWVRFMLNGGMVDGVRLVSERGFQEIVHEHFPGVGLGWLIESTGPDRDIHHIGGLLGYSSAIKLLPNRRLGMVVLANTSNASVVEVLNEVAAILMGEPATPTADPTPRMTHAQAVAHVAGGRPYVPTMRVEDLMQKVIDAAGGEEVLRRHTSITWRHTVNHINQGITGYSISRRDAPHRFESFSTFYAGGKVVFTHRLKFDGTMNHYDNVTGSYETCHDGLEDLDNYLVEAEYPDLVNWKTLFPNVRIVAEGAIRGERIIVVEKIPVRGEPVIDYISKETFRVLVRHHKCYQGTISYSDFRSVNEHLVPFTWTHRTEDKTIEFHVIDCEFNTPRSDYPELD